MKGSSQLPFPGGYNAPAEHQHAGGVDSNQLIASKFYQVIRYIVGSGYESSYEGMI